MNLKVMKFTGLCGLEHNQAESHGGHQITLFHVLTNYVCKLHVNNMNKAI